MHANMKPDAATHADPVTLQSWRQHYRLEPGSDGVGVPGMQKSPAPAGIKDTDPRDDWRSK